MQTMVARRTPAAPAPRRRAAAALAPSVRRWLPPQPLRAFIRNFAYIPKVRQLAGQAALVLPHPYAALFIALDSALREVRDGRSHRLPEISVAGPVTRHVANLKAGAASGHFIIVFQPGGVSRLFGVRASALTDRVYPAEQVLAPGQLRELAVCVRRARRPEEMANACSSILLSLATHAAAPGIESAASLQVRLRGRIGMTELAHRSGFARHRFRRDYIDRVGVGPKMFARILRFDYALRLRAADVARSWTEICQEAGYFDQNHMIKDFKNLIGRLPSELPPAPWRLPDADDVSVAGESAV